MTDSPTFISWDSMKQRCLNLNHKSYVDYGGRGVTICARWLESFENFYADMGVRPVGLTLDRKDVDGNYDPGNCRWATSKEQGNNRRSNRLVTHDGETKSVAEWAEKFGMSRQALRHRLESGWSTNEASNMKLNHGNSWKRGASAC